MEEILHQLIGSSSHYLQGFIHPRWCRIFSINGIIQDIQKNPNIFQKQGYQKAQKLRNTYFSKWRCWGRFQNRMVQQLFSDPSIKGFVTCGHPSWILNHLARPTKNSLKLTASPFRPWKYAFSPRPQERKFDRLQPLIFRCKLLAAFVSGRNESFSDLLDQHLKHWFVSFDSQLRFESSKSLQPPKNNMDTQNRHIWKEIHFKQHHFWYLS